MGVDLEVEDGLAHQPWSENLGAALGKYGGTHAEEEVDPRRAQTLSHRDRNHLSL
ncbi:hypothetical protein VCR20J5_1080082 [Vibrio crassostreae]|nr:hypothetical protein VCR20J5_1080082 [Vibrio crassostreae]CDT42984.1 hypothetical protein VCR15J5_610108 [Vibrio crassostreae]